MKNKEIFLALLDKAGYKHVNASMENDFNKKLEILELDRENVFHAIYGDKYIEDHGTNKILEYKYRLLEAENDLKQNFIKLTMHYIIMQIHVKSLTL